MGETGGEISYTWRMSLDIIGKLGDPQADAAAIQPVLDEMELKAVDAVVERVAPAFQQALTGALTRTLDGLTITITISRKAA